MISFTFKTEKSTGRWRSFNKDTHYIKLNKIVVGHIEADAPFKISFMVLKDDINEDRNPNCEFKWIKLKKESSSLEEAKEFINKNSDLIQSKFKIYIRK